MPKAARSRRATPGSRATPESRATPGTDKVESRTVVQSRGAVFVIYPFRDSQQTVSQTKRAAVSPSTWAALVEKSGIGNLIGVKTAPWFDPQCGFPCTPPLISRHRCELLPFLSQ